MLETFDVYMRVGVNSPVLVILYDEITPNQRFTISLVIPRAGACGLSIVYAKAKRIRYQHANELSCRPG